MATVIGIMGESGGGKTTSLRNLDPSTTYIIDADGKGLSWRGWMRDFNTDNKNYVRTDDQNKIMAYLASINSGAPHIKVVVIDTLNGIMVADEGRRRKEKGFDKWDDLAWSVWDIPVYANTKMRDDITVVLTSHAETITDDYGNKFTRIKTSGKKLSKMVLESKMSSVLLAKRDGDGEYVFEVHANNSTAKTPAGLYDTETVPNDALQVINDIRDYFGQEIINGKSEE
ncbi:MAG: AAA family ATPase [Exiguobacterium sp.]|nr:AAA family ATPase [Exiguobacterium sp.]